MIILFQERRCSQHPYGITYYIVKRVIFSNFQPDFRVEGITQRHVISR